MAARIRIGNDFLLLWEITRGGIAEDLNEALSINLTYTITDEERPRKVTKAENVDYTLLPTGVIKVEVTPTFAHTVGIYNFELHYVMDEPSLQDGNLKCAVDHDHFIIVDRSYKADDISELSQTSDLLIGLKGEPGETGTFEVRPDGNLYVVYSESTVPPNDD